MKFLYKRQLLFAFLLFAAVGLIAQNPIEVIEKVKSAETFIELIGYDGLILATLMTLGGYFSAYIPWLRNIPDTTYRVLTFAVLVIAGGVLFGFASIWKGLISYFFSTSLYEIVLKWFVKTKSPT